ncbi:hypothetical protein APHAL10511_001149 [Amanita phalloides]|nr:hypothetical protein APHAL10511_001149 [Amanita phalloides]
MFTRWKLIKCPVPSPPQDFNFRVRPYWQSYLSLFKLHDVRLDTVRDAKEYYNRTGWVHLPAGLLRSLSLDGSRPYDDDALCPDHGLPDNLFRGTRVSDGKKVVIKAAHMDSREYNVIRILSSPPLRDDPMNHTIPVLEFIEVPKDRIVFIVMEQWSSQLLSGGPCYCLGSFLVAMRQCIEHVAFLHEHQITHLDISVHNILTDYNGRYAYIDYETSQQFVGVDHPVLYNYRGTEVPPEYEREGRCNPYKVDVWALGMLILYACKMVGHNLPDLTQLVKNMLHAVPEQRPTASSALKSFNGMRASIPNYCLQWSCPCTP